MFSPPKQRAQAVVAQEKERKRQKERLARREQGTQQNQRQANQNHQQLQPTAVQRRSLFDQQHEKRQLLARQQTSKPPVTKGFAAQTSQSDCNDGKDTDMIDLTDSPKPARAGLAGSGQLPQLCSLLQPQVSQPSLPLFCPGNDACSQSCSGLTCDSAPLYSFCTSSDSGNCMVNFWQ